MQGAQIGAGAEHPDPLTLTTVLDPTGGAYSAPQTPLLLFRGPLGGTGVGGRKGREGRREKEEST